MNEKIKYENETQERVSRCGVGGTVLCVLGGIILLVAVALREILEWYEENYEMDLKELLYTLLAPLEGTGEGMIGRIVGEALPSMIVALLIYLVVVFAFMLRMRAIRILGGILSVALLINSAVYTWGVLGVTEYLKAVIGHSTIYEDYYVDPDEVLISADGTTKNLIYIYLESMETTYASDKVGGKQERENYMPGLTSLAMNNISFSDKDEGLLGGFISPTGTTWTIAALLASLSGVPFAFPMKDMNKMNERVQFASGLTTLGDILAAKGYRQEFLCGSDAEFGGRSLFFTQHGNYEIFDVFTAREEGYIAPDYNVWWGYEDKYLYEIAKDELAEISKGDTPFNFTMLTVDTHAVDGYECELCDDTYAGKTANVVACADKQLSEFIDWCKQQDFYEDTVIVIIGDHPRHDQQLIGDTAFEERTMYNCFINSAVQPNGAVNNRVFTTVDMFPSVLASMGFTIEGDRLGLGVNMFSGEKTLSEQLGYYQFNEELGKYSEYYVRNFS